MAELPAPLRAELYDAIINFALDGETAELSPEAKQIFSFIRPKLMRDDERYAERCLRNRRNGEKGGRPAKNPKNPVGFQETQKNQKNPVGSDNDNDSHVPKGTMSENNYKPPKGGMSDSKAVRTQPTTFREQVMLYFNEKMAHKSIRGIRSIANKRATMLQARVKEHGREAVFQMIDKAADSSFLNGENFKNFVATFDWLILPSNFSKVIEGNYDNDLRHGNNRTGHSDDAKSRRMEEYAAVAAKFRAESDNGEVR